VNAVKNRGFPLNTRGETGAAARIAPENVTRFRVPEILRQDPYGKGWLLKVKSSRIASNTRNLLSGNLARAWMENALDKLHPLHGESLGPVLQDGGLPVDGIARVLGGDQWVDLAKTHLLTDGE
jgi:hypothetical protein